MYMCCCFSCCKKSPFKASAKVGNVEASSNLKYKSDVMMNLEKDNFNLDESLDAEYLKGTIDATKQGLLMNSIESRPGYLGEKHEDHSFVGDPHYEDKGLAEPTPRDLEKDKSLDESSINTESIKSQTLEEIRRGNYLP